MRTVLPVGVFSTFLDRFSRHRLNVVRSFFFTRNVNFLLTATVSDGDDVTVDDADALCAMQR